MARGEGQRLHPFTLFQSKPSLPFAGGNRIVDFTLYNTTQLSNSTVYILAPHHAPILHDHWNQHWSHTSHFIRSTHNQIQGNAASVYDFLQTIPNSEHVIITACDHIYQMSYAAFWKFHIDANVDVTIATTYRSLDEASHFGVLNHQDGLITAFVEKPEMNHPWMQHKRKLAVNMGIYIFKRNTLIQLLDEDRHNTVSQNDFGRNIIPLAISKSLHVQPYIISPEQYWEDVGTVDKYWNAQWEYQQHPQIPKTLLNTWTPNEIRTYPSTRAETSVIEKCIVHPNVQIGARCTLTNLLVGSNTVIEEGLTISAPKSQSFFIIPPNTSVTQEWVHSRLVSDHT